MIESEAVRRIQFIVIISMLLERNGSDEKAKSCSW